MIIKKKIFLSMDASGEFDVPHPLDLFQKAV
jgi:hypothetical protein